MNESHLGYPDSALRGVEEAISLLAVKTIPSLWSAQLRSVLGQFIAGAAILDGQWSLMTKACG
jgi:hypothetical protein